MNNSNELLCGVPVTEYTCSRERKRVRYCERTKGLIVWGAATYGQRPEVIAQSLKTGAPSPQLESHVDRLRSRCHMHHRGLDRLMHTWLNMLLDITDAYCKCCDFLGFEPGAATLEEWEKDPAAAFAWLRLQNRGRKQAKALAKATALRLRHAIEKRQREDQEAPETAGHRHNHPPDPDPETRPAAQASSLLSHATFSTLLTADTGVDLPTAHADYIRRVKQYMRNTNKWDPRLQRAPAVHEVSPSVCRWVAKSHARSKLRDAEAAANRAAEGSMQLLEMEKEVDRCRMQYDAAKQQWKG
ncbi:hypothetical protein EsH8_XV_000021 [Colletotrichum jinshuiense]